MTKGKISPPNYSQIPNVIFDYWMPILSPGEFKVLMAIARKTCGWHKNRDRISLRQLVALTGLTKKPITKIIQQLIEHGLILKIKSKDEFDGSDAPNEYELNIDEEGGGGGSLEPPPSVLKTPPPVSLEHSPPSTRASLHTKETTTKENITPEGVFSASPKRKKIKEEWVERAERISTTPSQHNDLLKRAKGDERLVQAWYDRYSRWKIGKEMDGGKGDYSAITDWVIRAVEQDSQKPSLNGPGSMIDKNRCLAKCVANKFNTGQINGQFEALNGHFEISFAGNAQPFILPYTENGFRDRILGQLRKMNLPVEDL